MSNTTFTVESLGLSAVAGEEAEVARLARLPLTEETFATATRYARFLGVTHEFSQVIRYFNTPAGHLPAGFRVEWRLAADGLLLADLVRDINVDVDGLPRPTKVLFSADTANPYELEPIAPLIANLTCNPGIIYDLQIPDLSEEEGEECLQSPALLLLGSVANPRPRLACDDLSHIWCHRHFDVGQRGEN
ncbi:MAG TPA: hypothetical protein PKV13_02205 [Propionicimonas sp.]|nr:hypothetical protein [Propionicimonas sp.]HRA05414.1 hypothetical protein [Propionicimonas sp.]